MHEGFDVENAGSVQPEILFKIFSSRWQTLIHEYFDQKAEVLVTMEAYPSQAVVEHEPRGHRFFREVLRIDSMVLEAIEV